MKKGFSIVLTSTESGKTKNYFIPKRVLMICVSTIVLVFIVATYFVVNYSRIYYQALETTILKRRNAEIEREFAKLQEIKDNLKRAELNNKKIRLMLGIEETPDQVELSADKANPGYPHKIEMTADSDENIPALLPTMGRISRSFSHEHSGIDIAAARFSPVVAAGSGVVSSTGWDSVFGNYVIVDHNINYSTFYGHLNSIDLKPNDRVTGGMVIGTVGSTGKSTSPHLHYEVRFRQKPVDPVGYLPFVIYSKE